MNSSVHYGPITERDKFFKHATLTLHLHERPSTELASHSIPLHAVLAKSRIKDTANAICILITNLKIWLELFKNPSNPNSKTIKSMAKK